jgi:hypothetical protein
MKKITNLLFIALLSLFILACGTDPENEDNNKLGGSTDIALGEVGNTLYTVVEMNGNYSRIEGVEATKNENGVATWKVSTDISNISGLDNLIDVISPIYPGLQSENGKIDAEFKIKITSEGLLDYNNVDGKAHTLVKYDCKVGDKYTLKLDNGTTLTRTVTAKSSEDDFQWGFLLIKTITVEQNSNAPGISKYRFLANHKFGLVFVEAIMEDGTSAGMYIYPRNY